MKNFILQKQLTRKTGSKKGLNRRPCYEKKQTKEKNRAKKLPRAHIKFNWLERNQK